MLTHIGVQNKLIAYAPFTLNLGNPANGYIVKEITGLDPVKATLVSSTFANLDGEQYHSSRREPRNLVIRLGLKHKTLSTEELRSHLYQVFMPKSEIGMSFHISDTEYRNIQGVVESCEAPLFVKEPEMVISIMCFDPDFYAPVPGALTGSVIGTGHASPYADFQYAGTVPTGFTCKVTATGSMPGFSLVLRAGPSARPDNIFRYISPLVAGDTVLVNTRRGQRFVRHTASGTGATTNRLYAIPADSEWIQLQPGLNSFYVHSDPPAGNYELEWPVRHGGL